MMKHQEQIKTISVSLGNESRDRPDANIDITFQSSILDIFYNELRRLNEGMLDRGVIPVADSLGKIVITALTAAVEYGIDLEPVLDEMTWAMDVEEIPDIHRVMKEQM